MEDLVKVENNEVVVSSRQVATNFCKEHKTVLRSIKEILAAQNCATSFFHETEYENRGKKYPEYLMNRDGFSLLVMGFTGSKAMEWKIKYINAFNEMEKKLRDAHQLSPVEQMAHGILAAKQLLDEANKTIAIMQPKAEFYDAVADSTSLTSVGDVAKLLGVKGLGRNNMYKALRNISVLNGDNIPYQKYVDAGYFKLVESKFNAGENTVVARTTYVTQRGIDYIRKLVKEGRLAA